MKTVYDKYSLEWFEYEEARFVELYLKNMRIEMRKWPKRKMREDNTEERCLSHSINQDLLERPR